MRPEPWSRLVVLALALALAAGAPAPRAAADRPVVVELFTSQGCHSCPPADAFLGELARRGDVLALGFHVDYWDYIGWKDPFASPAYSDRQRAYARRWGSASVYTPQMVIDGREATVGSRRGEVGAAIRRIGALGPVDRLVVPIALAPLPGGRLEIRIAAAAAPEPGEIWAFAYDDVHATPVPRGENRGRTLTDYNVVRDARHLGRWDGTARTIRLDPAGWSGRPDNLAVLLQQRGHGPVYGAAAIRFADLAETRAAAD